MTGECIYIPGYGVLHCLLHSLWTTHFRYRLRLLLHQWYVLISYLANANEIVFLSQCSGCVGHWLFSLVCSFLRLAFSWWEIFGFSVYDRKSSRLFTRYPTLKWYSGMTTSSSHPAFCVQGSSCVHCSFLWNQTGLLASLRYCFDIKLPLNEATGKSLHFLIFWCQEPRLPVHFLLGRNPNPHVGSVHDWVVEQQTRLQVAFTVTGRS